MKRVGIFGAALFAAGALWAEGDPSITLNRVQQRYPWNGMVDIDYTVANVDKPEQYFVRFNVAANGVSRELHEFLDAATLVDASNGTYRVTWNSAWEDASYRFISTNANVRAELVYSGNDKSYTPYGGCYVIVDLANGATAESYPVETRYLSYSAATDTFADDSYKISKLVLRRVRSGSFMMGSPKDEVGHNTTPNNWGSERGGYCFETQHRVTLTQSYLIGIFPVTQSQWYRVMGNWPSRYHTPTETDPSLKDPITGESRFPVENVSYKMLRGSTKGLALPPDFGKVDEGSFFAKLSARTGITFDLPTEAQWENACRAGTTTMNYWNSLVGSVASEFAWFSIGSTKTVGLKVPNGLGLYDTLGNVFEICRDRISSGYDNYGCGPNSDNAVANPVPDMVDPLLALSSSSVNIVVKGGSAFSPVDKLRAAMRFGNYNVNSASYTIGFRVSSTMP